MNEIMTGSVDTRSVVSKMTLGILEDSGWYKVNCSMADHLDWGRNQGTEFVTSPCNVWKGAYDPGKYIYEVFMLFPGVEALYEVL